MSWFSFLQNSKATASATNARDPLSDLPPKCQSVPTNYPAPRFNEKVAKRGLLSSGLPYGFSHGYDSRVFSNGGGQGCGPSVARSMDGCPITNRGMTMMIQDPSRQGTQIRNPFFVAPGTCPAKICKVQK